MVNWRKKILGAFVGLAVLSQGVTAAPILTLRDTGMNAAGTAIVADNAIDPNYSLVSAPPTASSNGDARAATGLPATWVGATNGVTTSGGVTSRWVISDPNLFQPINTGPYVFEHRFSLDGFFASTANITGRVAADDRVQVLLNGTLVPFTVAPPAYMATALRQFSVAKGSGLFLDGENILQFLVFNDGSANPNQMGLLVNGLMGDATRVPELDASSAGPALLLLLLSGILLTDIRKKTLLSSVASGTASAVR